MATTAKKSPRFFAGSRMELKEILAADTNTWIAGAPCKLSTTGKVVPMATTDMAITGFFADSRATAGTSQKVMVYKIPDVTTELCGYISTSDADAAATQTMIGEYFGARVTSGVLTFESGNDTKTLFKCVRILSNEEPLKNATSESPGQIICVVKSDTALQG